MSTLQTKLIALTFVVMLGAAAQDSWAAPPAQRLGCTGTGWALVSSSQAVPFGLVSQLVSKQTSLGGGTTVSGSLVLNAVGFVCRYTVGSGSTFTVNGDG